MKIDTEKLLSGVLEKLDQISYVKPEDIPNIDLYMDQVTTFMDKKLKHTTRNPEEDKILTKTMINNYAKNDLLPPPVKKKYSKEHILLLIFIYYYKGLLSINDIQMLLKPITDNYFQKTGDFSLEDIYTEVFSLEQEELDVLKEDVIRKFKRAEETFPDVAEENAEFLRIFSYICMLSFDVYVKKMMIEKMIDELGKSMEKGKEKEKKEEKSK